MGMINRVKIRLFKIAIINIFVILCYCQTIAQNIYLNSYILDNEYPAQNVIFKVDLMSKSKIDSVILPITGQFVDKSPFQLSRNVYSILLTIMQNGVPGKNAGPPKGYTDTYYAVVLPTNLNILKLDSLLFRAIIGFKKIENNLLALQWVDEANSNLPTQEDILGMDGANRLQTLITRRYERPDYSLNDIDQYKNPKKLLSLADTSVYWDIESSSSDIYIFKHIPSAGILAQALVGDRTEMNIVLGYNESTNRIYGFITPYKMYSYSPTVYSADTLNMAVCIYEPLTLNRIDSLSFSTGEAYAAMEIGTAESVGPYIYYYYFWQDGYEGFDPAYLLIFDTRTNEADWLRVGWR